MKMSRKIEMSNMPIEKKGKKKREINNKIEKISVCYNEEIM